MTFIRVAAFDEIPDDALLARDIDGEPVALLKREGQIFAFSDVCTHERTRLSEGFLDDAVIECPRHGARFDVRTGAVLSLPAVAPLRTYPVRVEDGNVLVALNRPNHTWEEQAPCPNRS